MLAGVGSLLVGLTLVVSLYATFAVLWSVAAKGKGKHSDSLRWAESGRNGVYAASVLLALALLILVIAFISDRFHIRYVAQHSNRALPLHLKISAVWAGQDGSLLLWSFLQALFGALIGARSSGSARPLVPWATVFLNLITAFFVAVTFFFSNPFTRLETVPLDGQGLNPLLRHPAMVFHPPAMYLGYVGLAVPFAFAMAALVNRRVADWPSAARRWTLTAWLFLGLGLLLGARWAYDVLGWGGYWGWDPVENAGLMPWLTATALLHGTVMQERRRGFRIWNLLLVTSSFLLVLFGTFTTRSGIIQSVHAFARSEIGLYFLGAMAVALGGSLALMISRRAVLTAPHRSVRALSRDGPSPHKGELRSSGDMGASSPHRRGLGMDSFFILTIILLLVITGSVLIGSVLPTLTEALLGQRLEAGPAWFDRVTGPQFAALVLLMGVCPLLGRTVGGLGRLGARGLPVLLGAVLLTAGAAWAGFTRPVSLVGFAVVGLAGAAILTEYGWDAVDRIRRRRESPLLTLWHVLGRNRRRYGGYLVHAGIVLIAIGILGTRLYSFDAVSTLSPGESVTVGEWTLLLEDLQRGPVGDHLSTWASLSVYRDGRYSTTLRPRLDEYAGFGAGFSVPALWAGLREDVYVVLAGIGEDGPAATVKVFIKPLASFLWLGGVVLLIGGGVALGPAPQARRLSASEARRRTTDPDGRAALDWRSPLTGRSSRAVGIALGLVVVLSALVVVGVVLGSGAVPRPGGRNDPPPYSAGGRPLPGQPAPDFTINLFGGSALALSDLRGQVAVVNFWATWCLSCEEELPELQALWEQYRERRVVLVGVALEEEEAVVQEMASRFGITYPLGLDVGDRISAAYGITGVPETFVVDAQGQVAYVHVGPVSAEQLEAELDRLLGEGR